MSRIPEEFLDFFKTTGAWLYGGRLPPSLENEEMELYSPTYGILHRMVEMGGSVTPAPDLASGKTETQGSLVNSFKDYPENAQNINSLSRVQEKTSGTKDFSPEEKIKQIKEIYSEIRECTGCILCSYRKNVVPGMGVLSPLVMAIGEGPGADEDEQGLPFVGKAGQLLDKMLAAINLDRKKNVYIANVVKCRPPNNRTPTINETSACLPFLKRQIQVVKPKLILALGRTAVQALLNTSEGIKFHRGKVLKYMNSIPMMATYHPSALLRDESLKRPAWEDLKKFKQLILSIEPEYENTSAESSLKDNHPGD